MPIPRLWSKLESANDVTSPQLGTGGIELGSPTYATAKFNNGMLVNAHVEGGKFPISPNSINIDKGTIEFWVKMKHDSGITVQKYFWSFSGAHGILAYLYKGDLGTSKIAFLVNHPGGQLYVYSSYISFVIDDLIHFGFTWDREGNDIGDGKTLAIYKDNIEIGSSTSGWDTSKAINEFLFLGISNTTLFPIDGIIDNFKTYTYCKTDFSDRNEEQGFSYSSPITNSDIKWYRSIDWEEGDNHGGNINLSSEIISDELGNIFDDVSDEERIMGKTEYRKIYVFLNKETILFNFKSWIDQSALSPDDEISICAGEATNEDTQKDAKNYEYINPANFGEAALLGDFAYLDYYPIWIRRIVSPYAVPWHHSTFRLLVGF